MATELGQAYVQIIPSARGISGSVSKVLDPEAQRAGISAGTSLGGKLVTVLKGVLATAAIGKAIGAAITEGAALEQSLGGVETLFKGSADTVIANAQNAYKTAGVSANAYMQNVTSFSASLLQSLGGDTAKAASVADMAMIDMSDNVNKFGSNMVDVQNAYQGFAKQNFTMLDNLKLGYGGTKEEMQRLLQDAEKLSGVEYDISSLSDIYTAINVIQTELGVTGTTAIEASETFSGSFAAMKAAAQNVLGAIALGDNIGPAVQGLAATLATFIFGNFLPMIGRILTSLPEAIVTFFQTAAPLFIQGGMDLIQQLSAGFTGGMPSLLENVSGIITGITTWLTTNFPLIMQAGMDLLMNLITGILTAMPQIVNTAGTLISTLISAIGTLLPTIIQTGMSLILQFAQGFLTALPGAITSLGTALNDNFGRILGDVLRILSEVMPGLIQKGFEMIVSLAQGIAKNMPAIVTAIIGVIKRLLDTLIQHLPQFLQKGVELLQKIASGISQSIPKIVSAITEALKSLIRIIIEHGPELLAKGVELIVKLVAGLVQAIPKVIAAAGQILKSLISSVKGFIGQMVSVGRDLLMGLAKGISGAVGAVIDKALSAAKGIVSSIKNFFGIRSPSRVFMEIGEQLDAGLARGISDNTKPITRAMDKVGELTQRSFEAEVAMNAIGTTGRLMTSADLSTTASSTTTAPQPTELKLIIEGHEFSTFVEDITRLQDRTTELKLAY